ncbi:MAG: GNAT family N-acetyltransferase [Gemmatimonadota bacterium]
MSGYTIRAFETIEEFKECVALQEATWGTGFSERVPSAILRVGQLLGGVSSGAYDANGELVGFVFGLTGVRHGELAHWSDMLAVRPTIRDAGLGRALKEYQREQMLESGVKVMYWTFDPLQSRNAHLNVTRLGAVVREYNENMYGDSDSPLHRGIGTDRFVALWQLDSTRVAERLAGAPVPWADGADAPFALRAVENSDGTLEPEVLGSLPIADQVRVPIPSDVGRLMDGRPDTAREWRTATRRIFQHYLGAGYEVREFQRGETSSEYLLARIA